MSKPIGVPADVVVGIDLGTTMSAISYVQPDGSVKTVLNNEAQPLTPSAVLITDNEIVIGNRAVKQALEFPNMFAECFKRNIGQSYYPVDINGYKIPPEILCALLIENLKLQAERDIGASISNAVITVPAFYGSRRRQATRLSGELADLNVIDVVNEPTAAALAFGYQQNYFGKENDGTKILVYDLGGGTFDVSLLEYRENQFLTLATDGNVQLGGRDFDAAIKDHVAETFVETHGVDPRTDTRTLIDLFARSQTAKHELSTRESSTVDCNFTGMRVSVNITRSQFESLISHLIELTLHTCEMVLRSQKLKWTDINHILMVGGSSRIPYCSARIQEMSGIQPSLTKNPDELVVQGAALFAATRSSSPAVKVDIVNVNSHSLGIAGVNTKTKQKINKILIPRNTPLPTHVTQNFVTNTDNQKGVSITLLEGENENPKYCEVVAKSSIMMEPNTPAGSDIEVICQYKEDGTIHVSARVIKDRKSTTLEVRREQKQNLDSLKVWKVRLLNKDPAEIATTADVPDLPFVDSRNVDTSDSKAVLTALDYQLQEVGKIAYASTVTPDLIPQKRALQHAIDELIFFRRVLTAVERQIAKEPDFHKKARLEAILHKTKIELRNSISYSQHCRVVLGRDCLQHSFVPPGANHYLQDASRLMKNV